MEITKKTRYIYVDNLRLVMIVFVVMVHLACTYSSIGSWYYYEKKTLDDLSLILFAFFQSFSQAYFMGFLFLLAGFFVPAVYDKKGFGKFIKDRFIRLGIPTLIYMLIIHPFIIIILLGNPWEFTYLKYITSLTFIGESGPLWFAFALLIFTFVYGVIRLLLNNCRERVEKALPNLKLSIIIILIIGIGSFLIRLIQPIGTSIMNMQLCFFTQYIVFFIGGILAYRNKWFDKLTYSTGINWLKAALTIGIATWIGILMLGGAMTNGFDAFMGGLRWQSFAYTIWEAFIVVAMSFGLIALFKEKWHHQNKIGKILSDNAFGVYVFHAPIIIAITILFKSWSILPIVKFFIMGIICLPTCFLISHLIIRRIPLLKKVI
ncbi:MAG: hypothetical protein CVU84_11165 [Firmicutes bacterium HGW-Firmicutes-1]|jgi:surface polysaccharide O-acyltransferase-like enzyme|nr:MAG: hypothetical protein CVU84_11165 [Firmicutes bacterium HGW-Firmicutes-1]